MREQKGNGMAGSVFIAAISSDIGRRLAEMYRERGCQVVGTYRSAEHLESLREDPDIHLLPCDLSQPDSIEAAARQLAALDRPWERFISAVGQLSPIGSFFDCAIDDWAASVTLNSVAQLRLLHAVFPHRREGVRSKVAFLVGGGINGSFTNYSAYCLGKMMLVKMCELLDDEYPDLHPVAVGTGWVNTRIHRQTLDASARAGANYRRTLEFLSSGEQGTSCEDIFDCIEWCFTADPRRTSGRNFSVVHDRWKTDPERLLRLLSDDADMFKLRRHGN